MRVLMLTEAMVVGGAELFALRLADHLQRRGVQCDLLCLNADHCDPQLFQTRPQIDLKVVPLPALRWIKRADRLLEPVAHAPLRTRLTTRWIEQALPTYDVVHSHLFGADWIATALKVRRPSIRLVSTLHGDYKTFDERSGSASEGSRRAQWANRRGRVVRAVDRFVYISEEQRAQFADQYRIPPDRLVGIYNGVERPAAERLPPVLEAGPFTITMAARGTIPEKGWEPLIRAFMGLRGDVRLNLVGGGSYLDQLKQRYAGDQRIAFMGLQADPATIMASSHLFALPTTYPAESLPTVIAEALSVSCPVIATNVGEIPQMLATDGSLAGTLLKRSPGKSIVEQLRVGIQAYIDEPELRRTHSRNARQAFEKFDMTTCTDRYISLYRSLVAGPASTSSTNSNH